MDFMQIQYDEKFHAILETHLATIFKQYEKYTKKNLYQIHAYEIQWAKSAHKCGYFCVKNFINQRNYVIVRGAAAIFSACTMSDFTIATKIIQRWKMTRYWLGII